MKVFTLTVHVEIHDNGDVSAGLVKFSPPQDDDHDMLARVGELLELIGDDFQSGNVSEGWEL